MIGILTLTAFLTSSTLPSGELVYQQREQMATQDPQGYTTVAW